MPLRVLDTEQKGKVGAASGLTIESLEVSAFQVPTDGPEGEETDGTLVWSSTTLVVVEARAGGQTGLGYTYGDVATARLIDSTLAERAAGQDPLQVGAIWRTLNQSLRNTGRPGAGALALSAVDMALWDLKARLLELPLFQLLVPFHEVVPIYGSGGFCNYPLERLVEQAVGWVERGIPRVKIKTSRHPDEDPKRLAAVRDAIGEEPVIFVDANGALTRKEALHWAWRFRDEWQVAWFEEPVSSMDREGLRLLRDHGPPGLDITAGEYGWVLRDFVDLLQAGAVDCLQADVTRCGGITGLLQVAALSAAHSIDLSAHCAPSASAHAFCAVERLRHLEYFHDHVRLEGMLFEGTLSPEEGVLRPDPVRPGLGIRLKRQDAEPYRVYGKEG
jgi:L-alanine-DL-glutamate epimerase-like enolase superfamily enzyme